MTTMNNYTRSEMYEIIKNKFPYSTRTLISFDKLKLDVLVEEALNSDEPFITLNEASELIQFTRSTITSMAREGRIPAFRIYERWYFKKTLLLKYIPNKWSDVYNRSSLTKNIVLFLIRRFKECQLIEKEIFYERRINVLEKYVNGLNVDEIGGQMGLTRERIRQLLDKSLSTLVKELLYIPEKLRDENKKLIEQIALLKKENKKLRQGIMDNKEEYLKKDIFIEDLDLSVRLYNILSVGGYKTLSSVLELKESDMRRIRNCGKSTVEQLLELQQRYRKTI